jgi:hypothetical protein
MAERNVTTVVEYFEFFKKGAIVARHVEGPMTRLKRKNIRK